MPASPTLDDLCSCFGVVRINGCFFQPSVQNLKSNASDSAARRCSEQRLDLTCADAAEPVLPAAPLSSRMKVQTLERSRGTRQLRNLCKDAISNPTHTMRTLVLVRSGLGAQAAATTSSYLVDPASSHMLVLKIKPCMSKYKHLYRETANGSLKQLWFI